MLRGSAQADLSFLGAPVKSGELSLESCSSLCLLSCFLCFKGCLIVNLFQLGGAWIYISDV